MPPPLSAWPHLDPSHILYRDEALVVVHKPAGVSCQTADPRLPDDLPLRLRRFLAAERGIDAAEVYLGSHQRLDRDTSGLLLYTLAKEANPSIAHQFEQRAVRKVYHALVDNYRGGGGEQRLSDLLKRGPDGRMRVVPKQVRGAKRALTRVRLLQRVGRRALLELHCDTGRTHQLRVQLAHRGWPIVGDVSYGGAPAPRLMLHAHSLALRTPSGEPLTVTDAVPADFARGLHGPSHSGPAIEALLEDARQSRYGLAHSQRGERPTTAFRLFDRDADGLPGLALDVYDGYGVVHLFESSLDAQLPALQSWLQGKGFVGAYVKRHAKQKNELDEEARARAAPAQPLFGEPSAQPLVVYEFGVPFGVTLGEGLRTGLFLDQRDNRARVGARAQGLRVLNLFAYTGGFSVAALAGGAALVHSVDVSAAALRVADQNVARIGASDRHRSVVTDAFDALHSMARRGERFDLVIVDPPSYSTTRSRRFQVKKHYAQLCESAMRVCADGGSLLCCLNHEGVTQRMLRSFVQQGAGKVGCEVPQLTDTSDQRDFPRRPQREPRAKSVWVRVRQE